VDINIAGVFFLPSGIESGNLDAKNPGLTLAGAIKSKISLNQYINYV
jgi:hypothetical protein